MDDVDESLEETRLMAEAFRTELRDLQAAMQDTSRDMKRLERGFSSGLKRAVDDVVLDGARLSDALSVVTQSMVRSTYNTAMKPVTDHLGGMLAQGVGAVLPFAKGGVVSGPVAFPMQGATGVMGEAGPEAIMPLTRTADGRLGVAAQGSSAVHVTMNITTPDVQGFRRSQGQIVAQLSRVIGQATRNR